MITQTLSTISKDMSHPRNHKMSKVEAQQLSDCELLALIDKSTGHTGTDFSNYLNCDFSYTYLTGLIKSRGYENGWHKTDGVSSSSQKPVHIQMKKTEEEVCRQSYMISKSVASEWKTFNQHVPYKTVTLDWALRRFIDDYKSGLIDFQLKI